MYVEDVTNKKRTDYADVYLDADKVIETIKEMDWDHDPTSGILND
jgi:hypothetical protein